ncbi:MAG: hypothetical protein ACRCZP_09340 [Phycicoccus sp.]
MTAPEPRPADVPYPSVTLRPGEVRDLYDYLQRSRRGDEDPGDVLKEMAGYLWAALIQGEARANGSVPEVTK